MVGLKDMILTFVLCYTVMAKTSKATNIPAEELDDLFWERSAMRDLDRALNKRINRNKAQNVILFIGDGMSLSTVTAARIYKGQLQGKPGEEAKLVFEDFPNVALAKTYNVDHQVADSAATATAYLCGVKAQYGTLGVGARAGRGDCPASKTHNLTCILELAQKAGKRTGLVTTSRVTHATPAPLYSFSADRMWETDSLLNSEARNHGCTDIASQLVNPVGRNINVILGGGRRALLPLTESDPEYHQKVGLRIDGRNLIKEWLHGKDPSRSHYIWNQQAFDKVEPQTTDHLLGLFEYSHMKFEGDRKNDTAGEPSLSDMVAKAIDVLSQGDNGYFLLVEAARIDHGHHENTARRALEETISLDDAVRRALELTDTENTMIVVTADHSLPLTIGSYATRGNPILGLTDYSDEVTRDHLSDVDYKPYTTLSYANGPGFDPERPRKDLTYVDTTTRHYRQTTSVPLQIVSHDGTDVPIYATGPMSHLLHTTHEQHYIFHVMSYAACLGPNSQQKHCRGHVTRKREHMYAVREMLRSSAHSVTSPCSVIFTSIILFHVV